MDTAPADQESLGFRPDDRPYVEQVRARLRAMSDQELIRWGQEAARLAETNPASVTARDEARAEWLGHSVAWRWHVPSRFAGALSLTLVLAVRGWGQSMEHPPSVGQTRDGSAPSVKPTQQSSWKHSPNDDQPYVPLSLKHKAYLIGWRSIAPSAWIKSGVAAGLAQLRDSPEEWDQGTKGYGIRYGHRMLNRGVESGIGFGVAALLHQDGRYFRKPSAGFGGRVLHSVSQTFVTHTDNGGRTFSAWRVGGNYGAQFVSNAWRPESQRNAGDTMLRGTLSLGYDAASNLFKEFWPDIRRKIFKH